MCGEELPHLYISKPNNIWPSYFISDDHWRCTGSASVSWGLFMISIFLWNPKVFVAFPLWLFLLSFNIIHGLTQPKWHFDVIVIDPGHMNQWAHASVTFCMQFQCPPCKGGCWCFFLCGNSLWGHSLWLFWLKAFSPLQNSRVYRASPWCMLHLMLTWATSLELAPEF